MKGFLALMLSIFLMPSVALGEGESQMTEEQCWQQTLRGWAGIAAQCKGNDSKLTEEICSEVASDVEYLAAVAKIPFVYTGRSTQYQHVMMIYRAKIKNPVDLEIAVRHTKGSGLTSVYGRVSAGSFYSDAVETKSEKTEPTSIPKVSVRCRPPYKACRTLS